MLFLFTLPGIVALYAGIYQDVLKPLQTSLERSETAPPRVSTSENIPDRWANNKIIIGGKNFLESNILLEMMALVIEADTELIVERRYNSSHNDIWQMVEKGEIDIFAEYSGTILAHILGLPARQVRKGAFHKTDKINRLMSNRKITKSFEYLDRFGFSNSYVLVMLRSKAAELKILNKTGTATISDLAKISKKLRLKAHPDFFKRSDGLPGLRKEYGLEVVQDYIIHHKKYNSLDKNETDVITGYETDPQLQDPRYLQLKDDKHFFPPYFADPFANKNLLIKFPKVRTSLESIAGQISATEMRTLITSGIEHQLNKNETSLSGSIEAQRKLESVVRKFLLRKGLL